MAEAVVAVVLKTIGNLLIEEGRFLLGVADQVDRLNAELKRMLSFLKDADAKQNESVMVREWVSQTRDLAYQAEYLIERYAFGVHSRRGRGVKSIIKRCAFLLDEAITRHQDRSGIEFLTTKISELRRSFHEYGVTSVMENESGSNTRQKLLRRSYSHVIEEDLVGVESQVEMLAKNLVGEVYALVSICGMGGLGKTTLARKVYHYTDVRRYFDVFTWICISQQWQKRDLLEGIITKFMPDSMELIKQWRDEELIRRLFALQQNKKCLVVLDDIWSSDAWESIKDAFPTGERSGSKLLLTTRNREVATHISARGVRVFLHQPQLLSYEESWEFFQKKTLRQSHIQDCKDFHRMEELGKDIVKYCCGLPLAMLVLSGMLAAKQNLIEWENVHKNIKSYLGKGSNIGQQGNGELDNILELSYNDLPYQLKPCFLYLSKYSEDEEIETTSLYQIWMAEGLVSIDDRRGKETMTDVAERYLEELAKRSMIFVVMEEWFPSHRRFSSCHLHDIMRELCLREAKEENFLELIDYQHGNGTGHITSPSGSPRLAIHLGKDDGDRYVSPRRGLSQHLKSFTFTAYRLEKGRVESITNSIIDDFKMLKVLSVKESRWWDEESLIIHFPTVIGKLIHLRYLRLRMHGSLVLPSSICKLEHLQTLDLYLCPYSTNIPNVIWKLRRLTDLRLPRSSYASHFDRNVRLNGLHNLERLYGFDNKRCDVKDVSTLRNLRFLLAMIYKKLEDLEEFIKQLNSLTFLRFLSLEIKGCDFQSEKGSTLLRKVFSCSRLNVLFLYAKGVSKLPEYEPCDLPNLYSLKLRGIIMEEDSIRTLEKLPNMRLLSLENSFTGEEMIFHATGFPKLKNLKLYGMENLTSWQIKEGSMPNLHNLVISDCQKLKMIPDGLRFIKTLKELEIKDMPEEFKNRVQVKDGQEGEDFDKVRHVPSIIFK